MIGRSVDRKGDKNLFRRIGANENEREDDGNSMEGFYEG